MSDCNWGFDKTYSHRTTPSKWTRDNGFCSYDASPLCPKSFRKPSIPLYRAELAPLNTSYVERPQTDRFAMSVYGCHRDPGWVTGLRSPHNPGAGLGAKEMNYLRQEPPVIKGARAPVPKDGPTPKERPLQDYRYSSANSMSTIEGKSPSRRRPATPIEEKLIENYEGTIPRKHPH